MEHLQRLIGRARRRGHSLALLYMDLDRFRRINDLFDYDTGDRVLQTVSERLLSCVRSTDLVGRSELDGRVLSRLGGDEFTIVLSKMRGGDDASAAARRVLDALRKPIETPHGEVSIAASIGIAFYPDDGESPDTLLRSAKAAADAAKARGGGVWQFYREPMNESSGRLLRLETLLDAAIEANELAVAYQPQLELSSGRVIAAEALVRWPGCELGAVPPSEFVRVAEQSGMIGRLGAWVLRAVCAQIRAWREAGNPPLRISVNVSTRQLHDPDFPAAVRAVLAEERIEPECLEFEITESALLVDDPAVVQAIRSLREYGIPIALDDFGTGYSSLSHVVQLPIDVIKIDRSFVAELESQGRGAAIVAAVVALGRQLGVRVTAEGVERPAEQACLQALGCDVVQGYCVAPALDPAELVEFLRARG
jgi:diguanylate cyclase (GGDEF)-like protein